MPKRNREVPIMTMDEHIKCAEDIYSIERQHTILIDEFHKKKCKKNRTNYKPRSKVDQYIYNQQLFYTTSGWSPHPCVLLRTDMEDLMFRQHHTDIKCTPSVYFGVHRRIHYEFTNDDGLFSDDPGLTMADKQVIRKFNEKHYSILSYCMTHLEGYDTNKEVKKWMKRVRKFAIDI